MKNITIRQGMKRYKDRDPPSTVFSLLGDVNPFYMMQFIYMLPTNWILLEAPFSAGKILPAELIQGWTHTFKPNLSIGNVFGYISETSNYYNVFLKIHISMSGPCFTADLCRIDLTWWIRNKNNILDLICEKQICHYF